MAGVNETKDGAVGLLTPSEPARLNAMTPDLHSCFESASIGVFLR